MKAAKKRPGCLLGLDGGDRRIGLAFSDAPGLTAQGLPTLERRKQRADLAALQEMIATQLILQYFLDDQRARTLRLSCKPGDSRGATH